MVVRQHGNSLVRKSLDVPLFDYGFDEPWLVIDTRMPDEAHLKPYGVQVTVIGAADDDHADVTEASLEFALLQPGPSEKCATRRSRRCNRGSRRAPKIMQAVYRFHIATLARGALVAARRRRHAPDAALRGTGGACSGIRRPISPGSSSSC